MFQMFSSSLWVFASVLLSIFCVELYVVTLTVAAECVRFLYAFRYIKDVYSRFSSLTLILLQVGESNKEKKNTKQNEWHNFITIMTIVIRWSSIYIIYFYYIQYFVESILCGHISRKETDFFFIATKIHTISETVHSTSTLFKTHIFDCNHQRISIIIELIRFRCLEYGTSNMAFCICIIFMTTKMTRQIIARKAIKIIIWTLCD